MRITDFPMINEIKEEYERLRRDGHSRSDTVSILEKEYQNELTLGSDDDGLLFWIGLADAQYALKELSESISEKALAALNALEKMPWPVSPGDIDRRRKNYAAAPMEERKTFRKTRKFRCAWKMGDTFALLLAGEKAQAEGLAGRYALIRKVDEVEFGDGRLLPIVTVTIWDDQPLPATTDAYERISPLRVACGRLDFPRDRYEYRAEILFTSQRKLDALPLIYVGNFADAKMPNDEAFIRHPGKVLMMLPYQLEEDICIYYARHKRYRSS